MCAAALILLLLLPPPAAAPRREWMGGSKEHAAAYSVGQSAEQVCRAVLPQRLAVGSGSNGAPLLLRCSCKLEIFRSTATLYCLVDCTTAACTACDCTADVRGHQACHI